MELLDTRQLRAFQELARCGSFTEAATHLHLTQSAVSHSIKALEGHLDISLFERQGKQITLTKGGETFLPHVNAILSGMEAAQDEILNLKRPGHGRLRIGATVTISQYVLPSILRELRECFPNFEITVATDDSHNLMGMLEAGQIDTAVALESASPTRLSFEPLFSDSIEMAVSPIHPLATIETITPDDITSEDFIFYDRNSETYHLIETLFSGMKGRLQASLQVGSMAAIKEMAQIGMGVGLLAPWIAQQEIAAGTLIFRPFPIKGAIRNWGIYTDKRHNSPMVEQIFNGICRNVIKTLQLRTERLLASSPGRKIA